MTPGVAPALAAAINRVAGLLAEAERPWWIIGSAAAALHGAAVDVRRDVDVLVDPADVPGVAARTGVMPRPGQPDDRFWSVHVVSIGDAALPIDLFAGLKLREGGRWRPLRLTTRVEIVVGDARLFVSSTSELIAIFRGFGRPKDLERATLLEQAGGQANPRFFGPNAAGSNSLNR